MDEPFTSLHKIIKRNYRLSLTENVQDYYPRFRENFKTLCRIISKLSGIVSIKEFEEILGTPKSIPLGFVGHQEELIELAKTRDEFKKLKFSGGELLKIIEIISDFLKDDKDGVKFDALIQLLEHLLII